MSLFAFLDILFDPSESSLEEVAFLVLVLEVYLCVFNKIMSQKIDTTTCAEVAAGQMTD